MLTLNLTPETARTLRTWIWGGWLFLTIGITVRSYWIYYELGAGGWWLWTPLESSALLAWFAATALLHGDAIPVPRMATGQALHCRRDTPLRLMERAAVPILVLACAGLAYVLSGVQTSLLSATALILSPALAAASLAPLWKRQPARTPLGSYGMVLVHLGCAISMFGMASDIAFTQENRVSMAIGAYQSVGPFTLALNDVRDVPGPDYQALEAVLVAQAPGRTSMIMRPQLRRFIPPAGEHSAAAITSFWDGQLYLALGGMGEDGRWIIHMWWKPCVSLIWIGGALMALGGVLSLLGRVRRSTLRRQTGSEAL